MISKTLSLLPIRFLTNFQRIPACRGNPFRYRHLHAVLFYGCERSVNECEAACFCSTRTTAYFSCRTPQVRAHASGSDKAPLTPLRGGSGAYDRGHRRASGPPAGSRNLEHVWSSHL